SPSRRFGNPGCMRRSPRQLARRSGQFASSPPASPSPIDARPRPVQFPARISGGRAMARATLIGFSAVIMWAMLALFTDASGKTPPFLLSALTFAIGAAAGFAFLLASPKREKPGVTPIAAWIVGIGGLFGYHFFYFTALRNAPAAEASLI